MPVDRDVGGALAGRREAAEPVEGRTPAKASGALLSATTAIPRGRGAARSAGTLAELARTRLLLDLATLPDLELEAGDVREATAGAPGTGADAPHGSPADPVPALQHVAGVTRAALGVSAVGLALLAVDKRLVPAGSSGLSADAVRTAEPVLTRVLAAGEPLAAHAAEAAGPVRDLLVCLAASALIVAPVVVDGEPRGVLYVADRRPEPFTEDDVAFAVALAGRVGLLLERTELTRTRRELERQRAQTAARQELLGIVSHELKTPVAVLRAYTELLLARAEGSGRAEEAELLRRMEDQAARLLAMVEQVLDLQRLDAGLFPLEVSRVDLGALAERVAEGLQLTTEVVRLRVEGGADVEVRADRRRIEQVLINLLQNAIRFSPPGGEVLVRVSRADSLPAQTEREAATPGWAVVSVHDRGPGVAEVDRPHLFARFYQGQGGERPHRGHGGLGVGLYIAREIVARHGGDLWLEPSDPDSPGATFTLTMPIAGPDEGD